MRVATSDGIEQLIILGHGAERVSASMFHEEVMQVGGHIAGVLRQLQRAPGLRPLADNPALKKLMATE